MSGNLIRMTLTVAFEAQMPRTVSSTGPGDDCTPGKRGNCPAVVYQPGLRQKPAVRICCRSSATDGYQPAPVELPVSVPVFSCVDALQDATAKISADDRNFRE